MKRCIVCDYEEIKEEVIEKNKLNFAKKVSFCKLHKKRMKNHECMYCRIKMVNA